MRSHFACKIKSQHFSSHGSQLQKIHTSRYSGSEITVCFHLPDILSGILKTYSFHTAAALHRIHTCFPFKVLF